MPPHVVGSARGGRLGQGQAAMIVNRLTRCWGGRRSAWLMNRPAVSSARHPEENPAAAGCRAQAECRPRKNCVRGLGPLQRTAGVPDASRRHRPRTPGHDQHEGAQHLASVLQVHRLARRSDRIPGNRPIAEPARSPAQVRPGISGIPQEAGNTRHRPSQPLLPRTDPETRGNCCQPSKLSTKNCKPCGGEVVTRRSSQPPPFYETPHTSAMP